jgi:hypothetical protein
MTNMQGQTLRLPFYNIQPGNFWFRTPLTGIVPCSGRTTRSAPTKSNLRMAGFWVTNDQHVGADLVVCPFIIFKLGFGWFKIAITGIRHVQSG